MPPAARQLGFTLALALPRADEVFLEGFARGLFALAEAQGIELVGGDTTQGPLNICITAMGEVPPGRRCCARARARATSSTSVARSATPRLALEVFRGQLALGATTSKSVRAAMERPQPRVALGLALRGIATSAIGDLRRPARRSRPCCCSGVGAVVDVRAVRAVPLLAAQPRPGGAVHLAGGDDYELIFTAPAASADAVQAAARRAGVAATCIGRIGCDAALVDAAGRPVAHTFGSFDHFRS